MNLRGFSAALIIKGRATQTYGVFATLTRRNPQT